MFWLKVIFYVVGVKVFMAKAVRKNERMVI